MPIPSLPMNELTRRGRSLRHSAAIPPNPQANLSGWFERHKPLWPARRWLRLHGTLLFYSYSRYSSPQWSVDVRECRITAGSRARELVITRPNTAPLSLFAPTLDEFKLWFGELKRVSDNIREFYHLAASISHVSSGSILLGRDRSTNARVAVFEHDKQRLPEYARLAIQRRDARVLRATQTHSSVLHVIDVFETLHTAYVVTEAIAGGTLHDVAFSSPAHVSLSQADVRAAAHDMLSALAHLHSAGVVHGVVDGHSLLYAQRPPARLKLMAFGNAFTKVSDDADRLPEPFARAPEVVCFQDRTPAADVFAAGALIFRLLTGHFPFPVHHSDTTYLSAVSHGPAGDVWKSLGTPFHLLRCMLKDDAGERPTAKQCLLHAWFADMFEEDLQKNMRFWSDHKSELLSCQRDPNSVIMDFETSSISGEGIVENIQPDDIDQ